MIEKQILFQEIKPLHSLGFALHWLKSKSKAPIEAGWTKGPRKDWVTLNRLYLSGYNVGVRLGLASKIGENYLAVVDCDVKSKSPHHRKEMEDRLETLFPGLMNRAPVVMTGRGSGSAHYYILTPQPIKTRNLARSTFSVKVLMPSSGSPSKRDRGALGEGDISEGYRIRPAWEISLMSEGSQVVLPPSIHPDSGEPYTWGRRLRDPESLPLIRLEDIREEGRIEMRDALTRAAIETMAHEDDGKKIHPDSFLEIDFMGSDLPDAITDLILDGKDCDDRSAGLMKACIAMVKLGWTEIKILSALTIQGTYLGDACFEHCNSKARTRAAAWLRRFTLKKAREGFGAEEAFKDLVEDMPLDAAESLAQEKEILGDKDWKQAIERVGPGESAKPKSSMQNVRLILKHEIGEELFRYNDFTNAISYGIKPPWDAQSGAEISDMDLIWVKNYLAIKYRFEPSTDKVLEAIKLMAYDNRFHPVRDYLKALEWDGRPRIGTWLKDYLCAIAPEPYLSLVSRKILVAMVARIFEPGKKFDHVLILEGTQGVGKSTAVRNLASDEWFTDTHFDIKDKDAVLSLGAVWLVELGELSGMRKADVDQLKEFISRTIDRIRVPYGRLPERFPRQCVFVGTTNSGEYFRDQTGNRRFWPVSVGKCDFEAVKKDRDQLFAEAVAAYTLGEALYLDDEAANAQAEEEQNLRTYEMDFLPEISNALDKDYDRPEPERLFPTTGFEMDVVFTGDGPLAKYNAEGYNRNRAAAVFRKLGFIKKRTRIKGRLKSIWIKPYFLKQRVKENG